MEFQLEANLDFSLNMFRSTFIHLVHFLTERFSSMKFEHFQYLFYFKNLASDFSKLFIVCFDVAIVCISESIVKALGVIGY